MQTPENTPTPGRHPETQAIRTQAQRSDFREHSVPLYLTSSFVFEDAEQARALFADEVPGNIYTRFSNPNNTEFVEKVCQLEGAEDGITTASGMAAVFVSMAGLLRSGDHILASRAVFGSTHQLFTQIFPRWGITHTYVDIGEDWGKHLRPETRLLFLETPSNPGLDLVDLAEAGAFAKAHNLILVVDNCFATPLLQRPMDFGAHIVVHSATKWMDGQGRTIGGVIVGSKEHIQPLRFFARHSGPALSPFNGWVLSKSLETLAVRLERHCANALALAQYIENVWAAEVEWVKYPFLPSHPQHELARKQMLGGGGLLAFTVKGGVERGRRFLDALQLFSHTANLGDARTIATHPASTTHAKLTEDERRAVGIYPGLIRVSAGLEHISDLQAEIAQAFSNSR